MHSYTLTCMDVNSHHISYFPNSILQLHFARQSKMKGTLVSHQNLSSQSTLSIESTYKKSRGTMIYRTSDFHSKPGDSTRMQEICTSFAESELIEMGRKPTSSQ